MKWNLTANEKQFQLKNELKETVVNDMRLLLEQEFRSLEKENVNYQELHKS